MNPIPASTLKRTLIYLYLLSFVPPQRVGDLRPSRESFGKDWPRSEAGQVAHIDHWSETATGGEGGRPGGDVSATPINLPYPVDNQAEVMGTDTLAEAPEPGPDPFPRVADDGSELMREIGEIPQPGGAAAEVLPSPEGEFMVGELLDGVVVMPPMTEAISESVGEETTGESESERPKETPSWYIHEDKDGNVTVVDENGNPVDSPPNIVYFNGKYYAVYPGDDFPVKEDGSIKDANKLAEFEIESYQPATEGLYLHEGKDGVTVVDENGVPVDSPPNIIYYNGKYYAVKPGSEPINPDGSLKDPTGTIRFSVSAITAANLFALGPSAKYSSQPEESTRFIIRGLPSRAADRCQSRAANRALVGSGAPESARCDCHTRSSAFCGPAGY